MIKAGVLGSCFAWLMMLAAPGVASAELLYALTADHQLKVFAPARPGQALSSVPITGLLPGTSLVAIDFRPLDCQLYALGAIGTDFRLYRIHMLTGVATLISQTPLATAPAGELGFDFDPVSGHIRVVTTTEQNIRIDPATGQIAGNDTPLNIDANVVALGYTNNFHGAASTTLYGIDAGTDRLVRIGGMNGTPSPNLGAVTTLGALGVDIVSSAGLDVSPLPTNLAAAFPMDYVLYAALRLTSGEVRLVRIVQAPQFQVQTVGVLASAGAGGAEIRDIAILNRPATMYVADQGLRRLVRLKPHDPSNVQVMPIAGMNADVPLGFDVRPSTGELYCLTRDGDVYIVDPVTAAATRVGAPSSGVGPLSFFPGFDFDPATERIRIVENRRNLTLDPSTAIATVHTPMPDVGFTLSAIAYGPSTPNGQGSTLYGLSGDPRLLVRIGGRDGAPPSPDDSEVTLIGQATSVAFGRDISFDIEPFAHTAYVAQANNTPESVLYSMDLATGAMRRIGAIGVISEGVGGIALAAPGRVAFEVEQLTVNESAGVVELRIARTGGADGPISIDYATATGQTSPAKPGTDYVHTSGTLIFLHGETAKTISVPILNDTVVEEGVETFTVRLSVPTLGTSVTGAGVATIHVTDDDVALPSAPAITITTPTSEPAMTASSAFVDLAGTASDDTGVVSVTWSDSSGQSGTAQGTTSWFIPAIALRDQTTTITVKARDESGAEAVDTLTVTRNSFVSLLAEGATGTFFDFDILLANPDASPVDVQLTFLKEDGSRVEHARTLPALSRTTVRVDEIPGMEGTTAATEVTSSRPVIVERTMRWDDATGYGAHTEKAVDTAALTWYFAEGAQGFFSTYLLLANPGDAPNSATVEYLREGAPPITRTYPLEPRARFTVDAGKEPELVDRSFGMVVKFATPAVAERAMYFGADPLWKGGHESAGVTSPSTSWFLAEGATGPFFETFILLANPQAVPVEVTVTYLLQGGAPVTKTYTVEASSRRTINIEQEDPALANAALGAQIVATAPIVVERAQYWPYAPDQWYEAHNSFGVTATGRHWGLAEGRTGGPLAYETYILLSNPGTTDAEVTLTCLRTSGLPLAKTFTVPKASRLNVATGVGGPLAELADEEFSAIISSTEPIAVERAMYSTTGGLTWSAGTNASATRMLPVP